MAENKIISNIDYNIKNYSNYDITKEETKDIVDIPYFPAQNLVEVQDNLNLFAPKFSHIVPFHDVSGNDRYVGCLVNRIDARMLFINIHENKRYVNYRFAGTHYPQGREKYSISYDGQDNLIIAFGKAGGRPLQDIWKYNRKTNEWILLNYSDIEESINEMPSRRYDASIMYKGTNILIFGGVTDLYLTGENLEETSTVIPLNDIWEYDLTNNVLINYDRNRILPRRIGNVIYSDSSVIKILIREGQDALGNYQPNRIWIVDKTSDTVTYVDYDPPFPIVPENIPLYINGKHFILSDGSLYEFDNGNNNFTLKVDGIVGLYHDEYYFKTDFVNKHRGADNDNMDEFTVTNIVQYNESGAEVNTLTINLPPKGERLNMCYYDGGIFYYSGIISGGQFDEYTYLFDRTTYHTEKLTFPEDQRPTERIYAGLCYDKYRHGIWWFGGYDGTKFYNDLWFFDLNTKTWTKIHDTVENEHEENPDYPPPRQKAGLCVVNSDYLYIIGGYSDIEAFNDFWKINIPTLEISQEYPVDDIPWGTQYFIFEWNDRLWLFNGDPSRIYRYYYNKKQFVSQRLFNSYIDKVAESKINSQEFMNPPIYVTAIGNYLFVYNSEINWRIDLETRVVLDMKREFKFNTNTMWIDFFYGFNNNTLDAYYINISDLYPLTKNQKPLSQYYMNDGTPEEESDNSGSSAITQLTQKKSMSPYKLAFFSQYDTGTDTKDVYIDRSGLFTIQQEKDYLDKFDLLVNGEIYPALLPSNHIGEDLTDESVLTNILLDRVRKPWFVAQRPWYLYNKFSDMFKEIDGAVNIVKNPREPHISYIIYENGNICRFNHRDFTFYVYFAKIPSGCAMIYNEPQNFIYTFGGLFNSDKTFYNQYGMPYTQTNTGSGGGGGSSGPESCAKDMTHGGILKYDLNINEFNINKINDYCERHNITRIDYEATKDYILDQIHDYLDYYAHETEQLSPTTLQYIREKIYTNTHELIDDLSTLDVTHEDGIRPSPRAYMQYWTQGENLYIVGGGHMKRESCGSDPTSCKIEPYSVYRPENEKTIYRFDTKARKWTTIGDFPEWIYYGSAIPTPDGSKVIFVGGYTQENWEGLTNKIWIYDLASDTTEEFKGIGEKFAPRAMPLLHWIDEHRLLIQYGFWSFKEEVGDCGEGGEKQIKVHYIPVMDAWLLDLKNEVMYKVFEDFLPFGIYINDYFSDENTRERKTYLLNPYPTLTAQDEDNKATFDNVIKLLEIDNVFGNINVVDIYPSGELARDYKPFTDWGGVTAIENGKLSSSAREKTGGQKLDDILSDFDNMFNDDSNTNRNFMKLFLNGAVFNSSNFKFRYGWVENIDNKKILFVIGERAEDSGIEFIKKMTNGEGESHLRIWYCNLDDDTKIMQQYSVEYPIPYSPKTLCYDGKKYIYVYWNKYNIWRFNLKGLINGETTQPWYRLPPNPTLTSLDDNKYLTSKIINNKYFFVYDNTGGKLFKMDIDTFAWFVDRASEIKNPINTSVPYKEVVVIDDDNELYKIWLGQISGKYYDILFKQCDNFFFDLRYMDKVVSTFDDVIFEANLWPTYIKRKRLYLFNHLGHLFYSWIRIYGEFDVEYQLHEFYNADHLRLYTDYTGIAQKDNFNVKVFTINHGWVEIPNSDYTPVITDNNWHWDIEYMRRYKKEVILDSGDTAYQYSKCPPNYVHVSLASAFNEPISKVKVSFKPTPEEFDYVVHLNRVEAIDVVKEVNTYESSGSATAIDIIHLQPITTDQNESNVYVVWIRNDGATTLSNVKTFIRDNDTKHKWLAFSLDGTSWSFASPTKPLLLANSLSPGEEMYFYIKGINIDDEPKVGDIVITGIEPI